MKRLRSLALLLAITLAVPTVPLLPKVPVAKASDRAVDWFARDYGWQGKGEESVLQGTPRYMRKARKQLVRRNHYRRLYLNLATTRN